MSRTLGEDLTVVGASSISAVVRQEILDGLLGPGERLPSLQEIARRFGTTAITARRALRLLEDAGLVRVSHGVGSFVADWSRGDDLIHLPGFAAELGGAAPRTQVLEVREVVDDPEAVMALGLPPGSRPAGLRRVRAVGGRAIAVQWSLVEPPLLSILRRCGTGDSLYGLLQEGAGRMAVRAVEHWSVAPLPASEAGVLGCAEGAPGWVSVRTTFDAAGRPLLFDRAHLVSDGVRLRVERRGRATSAQLEITAPDVETGSMERGLPASPVLASVED